MADPMDEGDMAQDYQARLNADALAAHRRAMEKAGQSPGSELCDDCGEVIPAARLAAMPGCSLCVECMKKFERGV